MRTLLKIAAVLSVFTLAGCVVVPLPLHHHRSYGYGPAYPAYPDGGYYYGPRHRRW